MILVDANVLLYAYDADSPRSADARRWLEDALSSGEQIALPWLVLLAFVRISTNARAFARPLAVAEATDIVETLLAWPTVVVPEPGPRFLGLLVKIAQESRVSGPLVSDAALAAIAMEHGATLASADRDFRRFEGLRYLDPFHSA